MEKHFMDYVKEHENATKTFTENGAVAYKTSGSELLDFNFKITELRSKSEEEIIAEFIKVFYQDKILAIKYLFYVGDIRQGLGERNIFKSCLHFLAVYSPEYAIRVLKFIPEYSRWDVLVSLVNFPAVTEEVIKIISDQLDADMLNMSYERPVSLLAKWLPSENTSSKDTRKLARKVMNLLHMSPKKYRKTLSELRSYLNVVEVNMSSNTWDKISYESVPSQANLRYAGAFLKHDYDRRVKFILDLKNGKTKINASVAQPHEIVSKYDARFGLKEHDETLEQLWKALDSNLVGNTLVVRDGSGSMLSRITSSCSALDVATALAIYCSEKASGGFKDKFITFSRNPKLVDLSHCNSLIDKLVLSYNEADLSNTDIYKTMMLILNTAVENRMTQKDLPDTVLIISDMQFDGRMQNFNNTLFEDIKTKFGVYGYKLPKICFWNLCPRSAKTIPLQQNDYGLILCSGFSTNNLKMFMSGEVDPLKVLLDTVNSPRYDKIEEALIA